MRRLTLLCLAACLALPSAALADSGDFQLYQMNSTALREGAPANASAYFRIFANQLGSAVSGFNLAPPETLGHSGFNVAFEYALAKINPDARFWPTEGNSKSEYLLMPTLHLRKGLPFSFEIGTKVTYLQQTSMAVGTIEVKWALNEGFIYFPDLGVRGYGTHIIGSRDFSLTAAGLDIGIGHQFAIGGMVTLTPYLGWNLVYVGASTSLIDYWPDRSVDKSIPTPTTTIDMGDSKDPRNGTPATGVFDNVQIHQNHNNRFYFGLRLIGYVFEFGAEVSLVNTIGVKLADETVVKNQIIVFGAKAGIDF